MIYLFKRCSGEECIQYLVASFAVGCVCPWSMRSYIYEVRAALFIEAIVAQMATGMTQKIRLIRADLGMSKCWLFDGVKVAEQFYVLRPYVDDAIDNSKSYCGNHCPKTYGIIYPCGLKEQSEEYCQTDSEECLRWYDHQFEDRRFWE